MKVAGWQPLRGTLYVDFSVCIFKHQSD